MTGVFSTVLDMTVKAGVVIVAILLMRLLLLKAPKKFSYMLWSVAAFRLCVPVSFQAVFSIFNLRKTMPSAPAVTPPTVTEPAVNTVPTGAVTLPTTVTPPAGEAIPAAPTVPLDTVGTVTGVQAIDWESVLTTAATVVWLVGLAAMVVYGIVSYVRLYRRMQNAVRLDGNVYASDRISSPFTLGFIRPKIYLPFGLTETEQTHIIAHERYHIRRLDHIAKPFAYLLLAVHWFNPLCWLAFNRMSMDMEMSCDEAILGRMSEPGSKAQYTETLLSVASANRFPAPSPLAFNDGGGAKQRIKHALNWKKPRVWVTVIACVLCLATLAACAADTVMPKTDEPKTESDTVLYYTQPFTLSTISDETLAVMDVAYIYSDEKEEDTGWSLVLTPRRDVSGFQFIEVDESEVLTAGEVLYEVESLPSDTAVYVSTYINDATANRGISFLDVWGQRRYYAIRFSGKDGSLSLEEFGSDRVRAKTRIIAECEAGVADAFEIDVTFDGEPDLLIAQEAAAAGVWFETYVWDAEESCYWYADNWTLVNFALDTQNQRVLTYYSGDMHTVYTISRWDEENREPATEHTLSWGWSATEENGQLVETVEFVEYENGADLVAEYTLTEWEDVYALDKTDERFAPYFEEGSLWDLDNEKWRNFALKDAFETTSRKLNAQELNGIETFLRDVSNYGFLGVNVYTRPEDIDPISVFYDGAGLQRTFTEEWSDKERRDVLGTTRWEERLVHPFKIARTDVATFFLEKTGISIGQLSAQPREDLPYTVGDEAFMFSKAHDAYYVMHGDGAYLYEAHVYDGVVNVGGLYTVYYSNGSAYGTQYAVSLRKTADGYRFVSNQEIG